jgi:hypothetical protein
VGLLGGLSIGTRSDGNDKRQPHQQTTRKKEKAQRLLAKLARTQLRLKRF